MKRGASRESQADYQETVEQPGESKKRPKFGGLEKHEAASAKGVRKNPRPSKRQNKQNHEALGA